MWFQLWYNFFKSGSLSLHHPLVNVHNEVLDESIDVFALTWLLREITQTKKAAELFKNAIGEIELA